MDWESVWRLVIAIIGSFGGAGAIIVAVFHFISKRIAERLDKAYQFKIDEKLERIKASIEQQGHIRKTHFDMEFGIYRELCVLFNKLIDSLYPLFPYGFHTEPYISNDDELYDVCNNRLQEALSKYREASTALAINAAYIPKKMYDKFDEIRHLSNQQIIDYSAINPYRIKVESDPNDSFTGEWKSECRDRGKDINDKWEKLIDYLREYLYTLSEHEENRNG